MEEDPGNQRARILRVATRCTSADQFVEAFARFCDGRTLFVSSLSTRPIGTRLPFMILLADGSRAMRGQCEVVESHATPGNVYRRPGVKLALTDLDEESESMLTRLQAARIARDARVAAQGPAPSAAIELAPEPPRTPKPPTIPAPVPQPLIKPLSTVRQMGRVPGLPPLPRLQGLGDARRPDHAGEGEGAAAAGARAKRPSEVIEPRRVNSGSIPPPPTDAPDAGWSDDEVRSGRAPTPPPVLPVFDLDSAAVVSDASEDEPPALVVAAPPDAAAAALVAAAGDVVEAVPVVDLISRSQRVQRDSNRLAAVRPPSGTPSQPVSRASSTARTADNPLGEERTPGSSFILPANPFSHLTDESLQGFIDCTLYEDPAANEPDSQPAISAEALGLVEEPEPDFRTLMAADPEPAASIVTPRARATASAAAVSDPGRRTSDVPAYVAQAVEAVRKRAASQQFPALIDDQDDDSGDFLPPPTPPPSQPIPLDRPRLNRPTPPPLPLPPPPSSSSAPDWMSPAPSAVAVAPVAALPRRRVWPAVIGLGLFAVAGAWYLGRRDRTSTPSRPPVAVVAPDASVGIDAGGGGPRDAGGGVLAAGGPNDAGGKIDAGGAIDAGGVTPLLEAGLCQVAIETVPAGATIFFGKRNLGASPATATVDCGPGVVTARLPRFQPLNRPVTLVAGAPNALKLRLQRPIHNVTVITTPRGASILLNGRKVATTPKTIEVSGFTRHSLVLDLKGYQVYRTSITADDKEQTVAVPLVKLP